MNHHNEMPVALSDEELANVIGGQSNFSSFSSFSSFGGALGPSATVQMVADTTEQVQTAADNAAASSRTSPALTWWRNMINSF